MNANLTPEAATTFAAEWIESWNARELDRILKHYAREVVFTSPFVGQFLRDGQHTLRGIAALRIYYARALNAYPDLQFALRRVYFGARSLVIEYQSVSNRLAVEMMEFNDAGLIVRASAHYSASN
jgi:16S rRNA C1402 N4-methylase RsmH